MGVEVGPESVPTVSQRQSFLQSGWILLIPIRFSKDGNLASHPLVPTSHNSNCNLTSFLAINHWQQMATCKFALELEPHLLFSKKCCFMACRVSHTSVLTLQTLTSQLQQHLYYTPGYTFQKIYGTQSWNCGHEIRVESRPAASQYISHTSNIWRLCIEAVCC